MLASLFVCLCCVFLLSCSGLSFGRLFKLVGLSDCLFCSFNWFLVCLFAVFLCCVCLAGYVFVRWVCWVACMYSCLRACWVLACLLDCCSCLVCVLACLVVRFCPLVVCFDVVCVCVPVCFYLFCLRACLFVCFGGVCVCVFVCLF